MSRNERPTEHVSDSSSASTTTSPFKHLFFLVFFSQPSTFSIHSLTETSLQPFTMRISAPVVLVMALAAYAAPAAESSLPALSGTPPSQPLPSGTGAFNGEKPSGPPPNSSDLPSLTLTKRADAESTAPPSFSGTPPPKPTSTGDFSRPPKSGTPSNTPSDAPAAPTELSKRADAKTSSLPAIPSGEPSGPPPNSGDFTPTSPPPSGAAQSDAPAVPTELSKRADAESSAPPSLSGTPPAKPTSLTGTPPNKPTSTGDFTQPPPSDLPTTLQKMVRAETSSLPPLPSDGTSSLPPLPSGEKPSGTLSGDLPPASGTPPAKPEESAA